MLRQSAGFGGAGVSPAVLCWEGKSKDRRRDAGATKPTCHVPDKIGVNVIIYLL
jgi:hypothetical protein